MLMLKRNCPGAASGAALLSLLTISLALPAAAGTLYSWQNQEGTYAFTDEIENVPSRYRSQAKRRTNGGLDDYARFTPQDGHASRDYAARLTARLESLRAVGSQGAAAGGRGEAPPVTRAISLRTGGAHSPSLELSSQAGTEPLVVETVYTRPSNRMVTRQSVIVRQGDDTLAIVKPRLREWNVASDIHDESEIR